MASDDLYSLESNLVNKSKRQLEDGLVKDPIEKLRLLCMSRGAKGILGLGRAFRHKDDEGGKALNEEEFTKGVQDFGLDVSVHEIQDMFQAFDEEGSGSVNMNEFLWKLRPPMPQPRLDVIHQAFAKMDKTNDGVITFRDLRNVYSVKEHPKYGSGEMSEDEILTDFLHNFEGGHGQLAGKITREDFVDYYASLSASIDDDTFFNLVMRRAYRL